MMPFLTQRTIGLLAMLCPAWFLAVYLALSSIRPEYHHLTKAISELGSVDAPRALLWNLGGYIACGLVVALLGEGLRRRFRVSDPRVRLPAWALVASGAFMAMSGIFPGDFDHRSSPTMLLHTAGSLLCFVAFLVAGFSLPRVLRVDPAFRAAARPSLVLVWASIITGLLRSGATPGLGQRLGFLAYFLWVSLLGYMLYRHAADTRPA